MQVAHNGSSRSPLKVVYKGLNISTTHDIFISARKGVSPELFYDFAEKIKMPEKNLASLINLSGRTISNYKEKRKSLEPIQSEHLLKLVSLFKFGEEVFGNIDEFNYWLKKPFWNSDEKPLDWLETPTGVDLVREEMERMAQAYPV